MALTFICIVNKFRRVLRCQIKHLCRNILNRCQPEIFYKSPKGITFLWYASQKGYFPRLKRPRDFNEVLIAINLDSYRDEKKRAVRINCADKYKVREFVTNNNLQSILNICYGVFNNFDEIEFSSIPEQFVIKLTNGCGQNYICKDKTEINYVRLKSIVDNWFTSISTFGLKTGEWHYSAIKPRIIIEKYLPSLADNTSLVDYKFHCIHGKVVGILVCYDRIPESHDLQLDLYDLHWNLTDGILPAFHKNQRHITRPSCLDEMISIAESLSSQIDYVRVDLYEIEGLPVFGEMTFTPAGNVMTKYQQWVLDNMLKVYKGEMEAYDCLNNKIF